MLNVEKLHQYYGGSHILRGLSFEVKVGEVTCLLGRNGVGKTTLLKCLMGLLPIKEGSVQWEGQPITALKPHQRVHAGIAYVPQGREIFGRLTVEENLLMGQCAPDGQLLLLATGQIAATAVLHLQQHREQLIDKPADGPVALSRLRSP